jgi:hypothetical protein
LEYPGFGGPRWRHDARHDGVPCLTRSSGCALDDLARAVADELSAFAELQNMQDILGSWVVLAGHCQQSDGLSIITGMWISHQTAYDIIYPDMT